MNQPDSREPYTRRPPKVLQSGKYLNGHYCPVVIRSYDRDKDGVPVVIWHIGLGFDSPPPLILPGKLVYNDIWRAEAILAEYILDWALASGMDVEKLCAPSDPDQSGKSILAAAFQVTGGRADGPPPQEVSQLHQRDGVRSKRDRPRRKVPSRSPRVLGPKPVPLPQLRSIPLPGTVSDRHEQAEQAPNQGGGA